MKKVYVYAAVGIAISLIIPSLCLAVAAPRQMTLTGVVISTFGNQLTFSTTNAATYMAQTSIATLTRKYGAPMNFNEILVGDKIEVTGMVLPDNSINAQSVKNLSLYAHNTTFSGKIGSVNTTASTFTLESKTYGEQTIHIGSLTVIKKNGSASSLAEMRMGMSAGVKGTWERNSKDVAATQVSGTLRLVNISFSGRLVIFGSSGFTVVGANNAIYGVDFSGAKLQSKNGKSMTFGEFRGDDVVQITGKHISGQLQILASLIKDVSVSK